MVILVRELKKQMDDRLKTEPGRRAEDRAGRLPRQAQRHRGRGLPGAQPQRPGPAQLPHQAEQQDRRSGLEHRARRRQADRRFLRGVQAARRTSLAVQKTRLDAMLKTDLPASEQAAHGPALKALVPTKTETKPAAQRHSSLPRMTQATPDKQGLIMNRRHCVFCAKNFMNDALSPTGAAAALPPRRRRPLPR